MAADTRPPLLILMHPSAFVVGSPTFEINAAIYAKRLGFEVANVAYPLDNLAHEELWTAMFARNAVANDRKVYAYGDSGGAVWAARLAQKGLVGAAAAFSPLADVWQFLQLPGSAWVQDILHATEAEADSASPGMHVPAARQIYVNACTGDALSPVDELIAWGEADPKVHVHQVPGPHLGGGPPDTRYMAPMKAAIDWLGYVAWLQGGRAGFTAAPVPPPTPTPTA